MNLGFMHLVDYWIGVPLCLAVTVMERIRALLVRMPPTPPARIVLIELSEMGSAVLAYPAIREAVERVGRHNVWFMIFERNRDGVSVLGAIPEENILTVSDRSLGEFARTLWRALASGTTPDALADELVRVYGIDRRQAAADIEQFIAQLSEQGLLAA